VTLDPLYRAVAWILVQIHSGLTFLGLDPDSGWAWGGSIVLLTVLMRILIFPLFVKQIQSSRKLQALNPEIQKLRKKYKNDKQRLNQEMMKLYQENGANPVAGCLPLLIQFPIFISLFQVLNKMANAKEGNGSHGISADLVHSANNASIFGASISDSFLKSWGESTSGVVVCAIAVIISSTTTFLTMRASMARQPAMDPDNPMATAQKLMVWMAPIFGLFGLGFPLGVLLYWVTSNTWTLAQSHYIYKRYPMPSAEDAKKEAKGAPAKSAAPAKGGAKKTEDAGAGSLLKKRRAAEAASAAEIRKEGPKVVRKQPTRQPRSKRTGSSKR